MKRYVLTPSAQRDVNEIWEYIASDSIDASDRVLSALESAMTKLARSPSMGHWREELADKRHRFFLVYSYLIVYRSEWAPLQIAGFFTRRVMCRRFWDCPRTNRRS